MKWPAITLPDKLLIHLKNIGDPMSVWLNFHGIHDVIPIKEIGNDYALNRPTIKQILDITQRPKVDEYANYLFLSVKPILKMEQGEVRVE